VGVWSIQWHILEKVNMTESIPKRNRDQVLSQKELTEEQLEKMLSVNISENSSWGNILENIRLGAWLRFVVTKNFKIYLAPGSYKHVAIMEYNGIDPKDCLITNGGLREDDNNPGVIIFSYQASHRTLLHKVAEDRILDILKSKGVNFKSKKILSIND